MNYVRQFFAPLTAILMFLTLLPVYDECHAVAVPCPLLKLPTSTALLGPLLDSHSPHAPAVKRGTVPTIDYVVTIIRNGGEMVFQHGGQEPRLPGSEDLGEERAGCYAVLYDRSLAFNDWVYFSQGNGVSPPDTEEEANLKIKVLSSAYARMSEGTVYVLLQDGNDFRVDATWNIFEEPCLTRSSAVMEIRLIKWPSRAETIIWQRARDDGPVGVWPPAGFDPNIFDSKFF
ncbi:hypothetical protein K432DRAFT_408427 [Lepidopterella palustris CBS 459.81]|uniref:Uncharacterized protein n=1 Tax=Lepidopterella palustris CBS 459.81 TaxID=1314670 RepID=A0A8E2JBA4_9PEZI|nr:hypothetical protein K432DRAFT_408427 [Lepidopterella palustris CBS 459.81]